MALNGSYKHTFKLALEDPWGDPWGRSLGEDPLGGDPWGRIPGRIPGGNPVRWIPGLDP